MLVVGGTTTVTVMLGDADAVLAIENVGVVLDDTEPEGDAEPAVEKVTPTEKDDATLREAFWDGLELLPDDELHR